jgi:thiamine biosynthesis lipoprotein
MTAPWLESRSFCAVGTSCSVSVTAHAGDANLARRALAAGQAEVAACERALSRFSSTSDLCRLNDAHGAWIAVDGRLLDLLTVSLKARADTAGRFDPSILSVLAAAGYDRSFEQLTDRPPRTVPEWRAGGSIRVDLASGRAQLEEGVLIDLGGIGKGFSANRALTAMQQTWPMLQGALVDLGGDIAVLGRPPGGGRWQVSIADPCSDSGEVVGTLALTAGGVATSGPSHRRFGPRRELHHLIDPATGLPAQSGPLAVTVVAPDAASAEAHATALAVTPMAEASTYLRERPHLGAVLVGESGRLIVEGEAHFTPAPMTVRLRVSTVSDRLTMSPVQSTPSAGLGRL